MEFVPSSSAVGKKTCESRLGDRGIYTCVPLTVSMCLQRDDQRVCPWQPPCVFRGTATRVCTMQYQRSSLVTWLSLLLFLFQAEKQMKVCSQDVHHNLAHPDQRRIMPGWRPNPWRQGPTGHWTSRKRPENEFQMTGSNLIINPKHHQRKPLTMYVVLCILYTEMWTLGGDKGGHSSLEWAGCGWFVPVPATQEIGWEVYSSL